MKLSDIASDYLRYVKHERGLAETTYSTYQAWLNNFQRWLVENGGYPTPTLEEFSTPVLRRYLYHLSQGGRRPRTIRGAFHPLTGLGEFAVSHGLLQSNPVRAIAMPKKDKPLRPSVSTEELTALMEAVERQRNQRQVALTRAMLSVLIHCGVRAQELLDIEVGHVSLGSKTILISRGKGGKGRLLYPSVECMAAVAEWLNQREKDCSHSHLWALDRGRRVGYEGFRVIFEEVKAIAGLKANTNIKAHSIRHSFATRMMCNGASIRAIQGALGHADAQTTFLYLKASEEQTKTMAELATLNKPPDVNPRAETTKSKKADFFRRRRS